MAALVFSVRAWIAGWLFELNRDVVRESESDVLPDFNLTMSARHEPPQPRVHSPELAEKIAA